MIAAAGDFAAYGPSHWVVLVVTVLGAMALVAAARRGSARWPWWILAAATALLNLVIQLHSFRPTDPWRTLPLQLSDLAPYAAAVALTTRDRRACALTWYWGMLLSTQALLTPVLQALDFPGRAFLAFFAVHVLVVWAATAVVWGFGVHPDWRSYRFTVAATLAWAAIAFTVDRAGGANYGFLAGRPRVPSVLDLLGPWPWYLPSEAALVLGVWAAALTWPFTRHHTAPRHDSASGVS